MGALELSGDPSYDELLALQGGVITRGQALAHGMTASAYRRRITSGRWQTVLPAVAVAHSGAVGFEEKVQAAVLYAGPGAAVAGDALLHLLGSRRDPDPGVVDVAVAAATQVSAYAFFRPHRCSRLLELVHPVRRPVQLRAAPGVLYAAAWAPTDRAAEWRVAAAVQRRLVTVPQLRQALGVLPRLPRRALIRRVLDDVQLGAHARSELDFLAFLRRNRLPRPDRLQLLVRANGKRYLDAWWERQRVAAEVDGAHHVEVGTWDQDAMRSNAVLLAGRHDRVLLLRVTTGNLRHRESELAHQFRAALL